MLVVEDQMEVKWYYALEGKSVGPLTLKDLTAIFDRVSDARSVLVWREGLEDWKRAEEVSELIGYVIKPPPLPPSPLRNKGSAFPPPFPLDRLHRFELSSAQIASDGMSRTKRAVVFVSSILALIALPIGLNLSKTSGAIYAMKVDHVVTGKDRQAFIDGGIQSCLKNQENDPDTKLLSFPKQTLREYCYCYMSTLADGVTYGDLRQLADKVNSKGTPPALQAKVGTSASACTEKFRKKLLGAD